MPENIVLTCKNSDCESANVAIVRTRYEDAMELFNGPPKQREVIEYQCNRCRSMSTFKRWS